MSEAGRNERMAATVRRLRLKACDYGRPQLRTYDRRLVTSCPEHRPTAAPPPPAPCPPPQKCFLVPTNCVCAEYTHPSRPTKTAIQQTHFEARQHQSSPVT